MKAKRVRSYSKNTISRAALSLFVEKGVKATTTREIAEMAGISEAMIYKHYRSKGDLARELFVKYTDMLRAGLLEGIEGLVEPRARLSALIRSFFSFADAEPLAYSYIIANHHTEFGKLSSESMKPKDVFASVISEGIASGDFAPLDVGLASAWVIGMVQKAIFFLKMGLIGVGYEDAAEQTVKASLRVLGADAEPN
ncbi:MAG: TetR/AcrR family transcriptional regulator [Candidatus Methanosuratincola sp.]|jgi:AcrR family transcriptional regulator